MRRQKPFVGWLALVVVGLWLSILPLAHAVPIPTPTTVNLPGTFGDELGCASDWNPSCPTLTQTGAQTWEEAFVIPAGSWEYKYALNGLWTHSFPSVNAALNLADLSSVTFTYDHNNADTLGPDPVLTNTVAPYLFPDPIGVSIPGSFGDELGCSGDWQPACAALDLADLGSGVWEASFLIPAGAWEYKFALNDSWDLSFPDVNLSFSLLDPTLVTFRYEHNNADSWGINNPILDRNVGGMTSVPEPATFGLLTVGLLVLLWARVADLGCVGRWSRATFAD